MARDIAIRRETLPPPLLPGRKVLVIEDDPGDCAFYCRVLQGHGFEVNACESMAEGARLLEREHYDFVLLEQGSRAFEGRLVLERVLAIDRHLPAVVLTRCVDMQCYLEAMQMGAVDYVEKPLSESEVLRVVETHLRPQSSVA